HFSIPAFDEGKRPKADLGESVKSTKFVVQDGSVLLSKLNPRIPRVWLPSIRTDHRAVCSTEFLVTLPQAGISKEFLYCLLASEAFSSIFETLVTGTSGSHQRVKPDNLLAMDVILPDRSVVRQFTNYVTPLLAKIANGAA